MADQGTGQQRPAGWKKDPSGRHFGRWWDGQKWTENVISAEKVQSLDRLPPSPPARPAVPVAAPTEVMPAAPTIRGPMPTAPGWKPEPRSRGPVPRRPIDPADPRGRGKNQVLTAIRAWPAWAKWAAGAAGVVVLIAAALPNGGEDGDQPINVVGQVDTTMPLPATTMAPTTQLVTTIPVTQATTTVTTPATTSAPATTPVTSPATTVPPTTAVYYANCTAVRAAGNAPIYRGQPGYRSALDADNDGIACET